MKIVGSSPFVKYVVFVKICFFMYFHRSQKYGKPGNVDFLHFLH